MEKFTVIPHTADVGITARGASLSELFEHAAEGMFALLAVSGRAGTPFERALEIKGFDSETLLVNWLNELLYLFTVEKLLPDTFKVHAPAHGRLTASVGGRRTGQATRSLREIKAATYHDLSIRSDENGYSATIIFDV